MKCVNCKKRLNNPYKSFVDADPTRRLRGNQFYKGKRTTKHWCRPCWTDFEAANNEHIKKQEAETARIIRETLERLNIK